MKSVRVTRAGVQWAAWALSRTGTHYWLAFPVGGTKPASPQARSSTAGPRDKHATHGRTRIFAGEVNTHKKNCKKKFCIKILPIRFQIQILWRRLRFEGFVFFILRGGRGREGKRVCGALSAALQRSAVPQRPLFQKPGIWFHKTWNGSVKKLLSFSTTFWCCCWGGQLSGERS